MGSLITYFKELLGNAGIKSLKNLDEWDRADAIFYNLVATGKVPGMAVTIISKGETVLEKGYGKANLEKSVPVEPSNTVFRIASVSKCITGIALGKMEEEGILNLDDSVYEYVPYFPKKDFDFTLRQLACHTAGIRGYRGKEYALNEPYSIKDSISVFKNDPLQYEPGKGYLYNSYDFVLLSLAMQEAARMPFEDYVQKKVLDPLAMNNTFTPNCVEKSIAAFDTRNTKLAEFYTKTQVNFKKAVPVDNGYKLAGGGYLSTSTDIAKLGQAVLDKNILSSSTWEKLLSIQTAKGIPTYYGLGFQVSKDAQRRKFVGHMGNSVGAYSNFLVYPEEELVIAILLNCSDPKVQKELDSAIS